MVTPMLFELAVLGLLLAEAGLAVLIGARVNRRTR